MLSLKKNQEYLKRMDLAFKSSKKYQQSLKYYREKNLLK